MIINYKLKPIQISSQDEAFVILLELLNQYNGPVLLTVQGLCKFMLVIHGLRSETTMLHL